MKIAVAGSRHYENYEEAIKYISLCMEELRASENCIFLSGGCRGADTIGERFAKEHGYGIELFPAEWDKYGKAAGIVRNKRMAESADIIICFWDGKSRGTKEMINAAQKLGKKVYIKSI